MNRSASCLSLALLSSVVLAHLDLRAETLENEDMRIEFGSAERGYGVLGIVNKLGGGQRFVLGAGAAQPDLWELRFVRSETKDDVLISNRNAGGARSVVRETDRIVFRWTDVPLPADGGTFDLDAEVRLRPDGASEWRLDCRNRSSRYALSRTRYPLLRRVADEKEVDVVRPFPSTGMCVTRKSMTKGGTVSPGPYPMVSAYFIGEAGLYFAAHDGRSRIKKMEINRDEDQTVCFDTPMENAGVVGKAGSGPGYPVVVKCLRGDWWEVARTYRAWALGQRWCAAGTILKRGGSAKEAADRQLWLLCGSEAKTLDRVVDGMLRLWPDVKLGLENCGWNYQQGNLGSPESFPCRRDMDVVQKKGVGKGLLMQPYVNPRLWDVDTAGFRYAFRDAIRRENGEIATESWSEAVIGKPNVRHHYAVMCPKVGLWQDIVADACARLMTNQCANALYLDQLACSQAIECHDPSHGHPVGGGTWYEEGCRELLQKIRDFGEAHGGVVITSEQVADMWDDLIDAHLVCDPPFDARQVPFLQAVYSGYTTYYGYPGNAADAPDVYFRKIAQPFVWGIVPGWLNPMLALDDRFRGVAEVLGRLARFRAANMEYLAYGQLVGELKPLEPAEGVVGALWKGAVGGKLAMVLANTATARRIVKFRFPHESDVKFATLEPQTLILVE